MEKYWGHLASGPLLLKRCERYTTSMNVARLRRVIDSALLFRGSPCSGAKNGLPNPPYCWGLKVNDEMPAIWCS